MRLIDADALMERLHEFANDDWNKSLGGVFTDAVDTCIDFVENAETIEAVPVVHAEWKMRGGKLYCTNCGKKALEEKDRDDWYGCERSNFCPHCGADIRKKV